MPTNNDIIAILGKEKVIEATLQPAQGIRAETDTVYLYNPDAAGIHILHDDTLKGKGTGADPLGVSDKIMEEIENAGKVDDVRVNGVSVVENKVADVTVPTKTSDLTNDSEYQNATQISETVSGAINIHNTSNDAHSNIITPIKANITDIQALIPAQASEENKLADKNFVNSSVATNTSYFIGTFNSVEELKAYTGEVTNNDYAFVISTDAQGNTVYNRYKYNGDTQGWLYEYSLNNSSFTADQWAAINSGATPEAIAQINTNTNDIADLQTNKQDKLTAGEHITIDKNNVISAEAGLPDGEPLSLYGTNEVGEPEAYKVKPEIVLHNKILPAEYEELDYISNTVAYCFIGENTNQSCHPSIEDFNILKNMFNTAEESYNKTVNGFKFTYVDSSNEYWDIYAIQEDGTEHLWAQNISTSQWISSYGLGFYRTNAINVGDYFIVVKDGKDGGQYIDTGVKIERKGHYDKANSLLVDGVNVALNLTDTFFSNFGNYDYVDFRAYYPSGTTDLRWGTVPSGNTFPINALTAEEVEANYGIAISGNIVIGDATPQTTGTVVRIVIDKYTFAIKTAAKLYGDGVDGIIFGSDSTTDNFGISIETTMGDASFANLGFSSKATYIPIPNDFVDIKAETTTGNYKLVVGENETSLTETTQRYYTPNTITLFANNNENGITCSALPTSIKRTTIWKNGEIVFDGVPCREIATGNTGMFDLVNAEFLHSPTETPFAAGNVIEYPYVSTDVINITGDEHIDIVKGLDNDEYVQLDYLESDGTCAIDLGIIPTYASIFETKIKNEYIPNTPDVIRAVYGYWGSKPDSQTGCGLYTGEYSSMFAFGLCWISGPHSYSSANFIGGDTNWHTFKIGKTGAQSEVHIDGIKTWTYNEPGVTGERSIALFGRFTETDLLPSFIGKIAYFREYRRNNNYDNIIIHDFVPVKRKSDGVLGFYDKITGKFCTNEGTGTFTAGGEYGVKANYIPDDNDSRTLMRNELQNNMIDSGSVRPANLANTRWTTVYGAKNTFSGLFVSSFGANNSIHNDYATVLGSNNNQGGGQYSTIVGSGNTTQSSQNTVVGYGNALTGQNATVVGASNNDSTSKKVARETTVVGAQTYNYNTPYSVIIGSKAGVRTSGHDGVTVIGYNARGSAYSAVVGRNAISYGEHGIAMGDLARVGVRSTYSIAIGNEARVDSNNGAPYSIAIGKGTLVQAEDAILLGRGTNSEPHSFYVGFANGAAKLLDSSFVIPYARLTSSSPVADYCLKYDANTDSLVWGEAGTSYTLPTATTTRLGGVKVGNGLSVAGDGTLSADIQSNNFEDIGGDPYDNQALSGALDGLQANINTVQSDLQAQIDNIQSIGEFLAIWDSDTGVARYLTSGFVYPTGGYFIIGSVAEAGQPNYMPDGSTYTGPSTTVTTEDVKVSDMWFYDGTHWIYLANHERAVAVDADLSTTSTNPVENKTITLALQDKQDTLEAGKGITIDGNVISVSGDSVGVPQIANVYSQQVNSQIQATNRASEETRLGFYSDILFNLNLTKDQILDKMDELYIGIERFKRNKITHGTTQSGEYIYYNNIPNFKLQNDKFVHLDQKMFCYRYETGEYGIDDPRHYIVFYTDAEYTDYQTMMNTDPTIWCFYGQWIGGNQPSCLNTLRSVGAFSDFEDGTLTRYPEGDLEVFVNIDRTNSIDRGYIDQRKCRSYIIDGVKKYFWSEDWYDSTKEVYTTADGKIPDSYVNTIISENKTVNDYAGMEYTQRSDLDYWHFNFDSYNVSDWILEVLGPATLLGKEWGNGSQHTPWKCYWLDYPLQPVLLQDCEVLASSAQASGWFKLKTAIKRGMDLPENLVFRYPYNSAELWLRFSAWQKRCMYNEYMAGNNQYLQLTQKQALAYAWVSNNKYLVKDRRAFGRQRNRYSGYSIDAKICEYIQFNLYTPYNVYGGTKSKSTPIKKRLVINQNNGSSTIRD